MAKIRERVRININDKAGSVFTNDDILLYINEGVDRVKSHSALKSIEHMLEQDSTPTPLPSEYHYLLAVYATARCFAQDERYYQATSFMNEFEHKFNELSDKINSGEVIISDSDGNRIDAEYVEDFVINKYFSRKGSSKGYDLDDGVSGLE